MKRLLQIVFSVWLLAAASLGQIAQQPNNVSAGFEILQTGPNKVVLSGVNGDGGFNPLRIGSLAAYYDFTDTTSLKVDASNRVSYAADKSGNSAVMGLVLPGTASNSATTPSSSALNIAGDITVTVAVRIFNVAPSALGVLLSKDAGAGQTSYNFYLNTDSKLHFIYSVDGTTQVDKASSSAVPFANQTDGYYAVTQKVNNGAGGNDVKFWTSADGVTWTQLGTTQTTAAVIAKFSSTSRVAIGLDGSGNGFDYLAGLYYRAKIYSGIGTAFGGAGGETLVFDANFSAQARGTTSFAESSSNAATVTVNTSGDLGARICGARDLAQLTGSKQPTLLPWNGQNYLANFGVTGNSASTPDSVAVSITGSIDIAVRVALADYTPLAYQGLVYKEGGAGHRSFYFAVIAGGSSHLEFGYSNDGTNDRVATADAPTGLTDGSIYWLRVTYDSVSGDTIFYSAANTGNNTPPSVWTKIGTTRTITAGTIFDSDSPVTVGGVDVATGSFYYAELRNGIGGTVVAKMDASQAVHNATSWTSSTGEVWTVNQSGAKPAQIVGRQTMLFDGTSWYMKAPPFALNQPETVVMVGKQNVWATTSGVFDGNAVGSLLLQQHTSSPNVNINAGSYITDVGDLALGRLGVVAGVFNGASSALRINRLTGSTGNAGAGNAGGFTIGGVGNGTQNSAIQASRVFIFSTALDTPTLDQVGAWSAAKDLVPNY